MDDNTLKRNLLLIVFAAFLLRILCALPVLLEAGSPSLIRIDSWTYFLPAQALLQDGCIWSHPGSGVIHTVRPPGYILLLAGGLLFSKSLLIPSVSGMFFSAFSCFPVGLTAAAFGGRKAGYCAAVLMALNLTGIANSPLVLPDTVLGLCCAWALYWSIIAFRKQLVREFFFACAALLAGCWMKPVCVPLLLGGMPLLALVFFAGNRKKLFVCWGVVLGVYMVGLLPWMIRNYNAGAEFDIDSNRGEMLYHSGAAILGKVTGKDTGLLRQQLREQSENHFAAHKEEFALTRTRNYYNHKRYVELIKKYPVAFLQTHLPQWAMLLPDLPAFLENNRLTTTGRGTLDVLRKKGLLAALGHYLDGKYALALLPLPFLLATGILYGSSIMMGLCLLKKFRWKELIFCGAFGLYLLFAGGPVTMPRYQIPALPLLCVLGGIYCVVLFRKYQVLRKKHIRG